MQGLGYAYVIMPALKRLYGDDPESMKKALQMHLAYFNTTPAMSHLITGADMALEEEIGIESEEVVMGIKTGLMGPFAGVGDTLFIAIYRAIVFSIAAYIAMQGNPVGLLIPLIACAGVLWVRYNLPPSDTIPDGNWQRDLRIRSLRSRKRPVSWGLP